MTDSNQKINLTPEQIISLVGHGVTQEQLDGVRREIGDKIERLDNRIERIEARIDAKIDSIKNWLIGSLFTVVILLVGGFGYVINLIDK